MSRPENGWTVNKLVQEKYQVDPDDLPEIVRVLAEEVIKLKATESQVKIMARNVVRITDG